MSTPEAPLPEPLPPVTHDAAAAAADPGRALPGADDIAVPAADTDVVEP